MVRYRGPIEKAQSNVNYYYVIKIINNAKNDVEMSKSYF